MSYFRVEVVRLNSFGKHPDPETTSLSITNIFDYPVIFKSGTYNVGDLVAYLPVDSVVTLDRPEFSWLAKEGGTKKTERIRAKRLRGKFSMGILIPAPPGSKEGDDVKDLLGVTKYEEPEPISDNSDAERDYGIAPKYDVENFRRYSYLFNPGEEVVVTEKLHGCVPHTTRISMSDGSRRKITEIRVGDEILGVGLDGKVIPTKVLQVFNNGRAQNWIKVKGNRKGAGRGSHFSAVTCTPNHKIWSETSKDYVEAQHLNVGDDILVLRSELGLTPIQDQVLLGKMLGDGYLHDTQWSAAVTWSHSDKYREYVEWTAKALGDIAHPNRDFQVSGYGSNMTRAHTVFSALIKEKFSDFYSGDNKKVPEWVAESLGPIAIAFWYMDDGSLSHHIDQEDRANFAVCVFTEDDCKVLQKGLQKFGINSVYYQSNNKGKNHSRLRLNADEAEKLFLLISPYIPPCMQYKLPERYRGHSGWLPHRDAGYKSILVKQTVTSVEQDLKIRSSKYDLETDTHNFFANGILVHNSNAMYCFHDGKLLVRSHHQYKREFTSDGQPTTSMWWVIARKLDLATKLATIPDLALYGEIFGNVQDLSYGAKKGEVFFRAFDLFDTKTGEFINYDLARSAITKLGIEWVPEVYRGPFEMTKIQSLADGKSTIADNIREGVVIKPVVERYDGSLGRRLSLKLISESYLLRKNGTERH